MDRTFPYVMLSAINNDMKSFFHPYIDWPAYKRMCDFPHQDPVMRREVTKNHIQNMFKHVL